jgi:hypothetical protein
MLQNFQDANHARFKVVGICDKVIDSHLFTYGAARSE